MSHSATLKIGMTRLYISVDWIQLLHPSAARVV